LQRTNIPEPESFQGRQRETTIRTCNVSERIAAHVSVPGGVGSFSDADSVEDDDGRALQSRNPV
jgi:hypothetical protein